MTTQVNLQNNANNTDMIFKLEDALKPAISPIENDHIDLVSTSFPEKRKR